MLISVQLIGKNFSLCLEPLPHGSGDFGFKIQINVTSDGRCKSRKHPIIVFGSDRIVLVIMATSTADRQTQESTPDRGQHVVESIVSGSFDLVGGDLSWKTPAPKKPVAIMANGSSGAISSPASCQRTN